MPVEALVVQASYVGASLDKGLQGAQKELAATAKEAAKLDSTLGKGLTKGTNTAGQSLQNLGRIAQDAPFGFIGIQNNINPLLESFGRLKAETGSTGGALKALAGSLLGAGGLGLAVSLATGLLTVLAQQGFFKTEKAADKAGESLKAFNDSLRDTEASTLATGVKLQSFINIAKNGDLPQKQRNEALQEANKILGNYGEKLTLANVATAAITEQTKKFTEATIQQALATKFADRAADLIIQQRDASKIYAKELQKLNDERDRFNKTFTTNATASEAAAARLQQGARALQDQEKAVVGAANTYKTITGEVKEISAQLTAAQLASTGLFGQLGERSKEDATKTVKSVDTITSTLQNLQKEIQFLNSVQLTFGTNESAAKIKEIESAIRTLIKDFKVDPQDTIIQKLLTGGKVFNLVQGLNIPGIRGLTENVEKLISTEVASQGQLTVTVPVNVQAAIDKIDVGKIVGPDSEFEAQLQEVTDRLRQTVANSFASIFEGIGAGVSAQGIFGNFFKTIFTELGTGIQQLGIQSAVFQKLLAGLRASFGSPTGLAASIGLIALGGVIKGLASRIQLPTFATGGTAPGGSILVGERGPEIITAPRGATITPNAQTNAMLSGAGGGTVVFRIQGRELVGVLNNTNATLGRNGQG